MVPYARPTVHIGAGDAEADLVIKFAAALLGRLASTPNEPAREGIRLLSQVAETGLIETTQEEGTESPL